MWRTPTNRLSLLLVPLLALAGCTRKESDEARLKKLIDTLPVHVYVGARAAIADTSDSRQLKVLRQRLIRIVVSGQTRDGKQEDLSLSELGGVARQVVRLRRRGAQMVREGKDSPPILPVVLGQQRFGPGYDANTEHCITLAGMFVAKFHPRSPVPVPEELLLYEAARADPTRKPVATGAMPLHAIRAVIFARNALCDLAQREASAAFDAPNTKRLRALLTDIGQTTITDAQLTSLAAGLEVEGHHAAVDRGPVILGSGRHTENTSLEVANEADDRIVRQVPPDNRRHRTDESHAVGRRSTDAGTDRCLAPNVHPDAARRRHRKADRRREVVGHIRRPEE